MSIVNWSTLTIANVRGKSRLTSCKSVSPLKVFNPQQISDYCFAVLSNYGGGYVQGDQINIKINIKENAKCYMSTQANTRIYRSQNGKGSSQIVHGMIEANGIAILLPDPVVPHSGSRFKQSQIWDLEKSSSLILVETLHPGRMGIGEEFSYGYFSSDLSIRVGQKLIVKDHYVFEPDKSRLEWPGNFGPYRIMTNVFFVGESLVNSLQSLKVIFNSFTSCTMSSDKKIEANRRPTLADRLPAFLLSMTPVKKIGYVLRILARETAEVNQVLTRLWDYLTQYAIVDWDPTKRRF